MKKNCSIRVLKNGLTCDDFDIINKDFGISYNIDDVLINALSDVIDDVGIDNIDLDNIVELDPIIIDGYPAFLDREEGWVFPDTYTWDFSYGLFVYDEMLYAFDHTEQAINVVEGLLCLLHQTDLDRYGRPEVRSLIIKVVNDLRRRGELVLYDYSKENQLINLLINGVEHDLYIGFPRYGILLKNRSHYGVFEWAEYVPIDHEIVVKDLK